VPVIGRVSAPVPAAARHRARQSCGLADKQEADNGDQGPAGKVVAARHQRVERRLRRDVVGGAGDNRKAGRADELPRFEQP